MPSYSREVLVEMFRDQPALVAELLTDPLGVTVPPFDRAGVSPGELTDVAPTEYRADAVVTLIDGDKPVLAVVVEIQLRVDQRKRRSWPAYVATLHARLGCPAVLLVVCLDPAVAAWCSVPIRVGEPGMVLTPVVLGPQQIPVITDPKMARRQPEVAVLEALMTTTPHRYQSDFARRYFTQGEAQGEARGEARAVLAVLESRGIAIPDDAREKITGCSDVHQLDTWVRRAVSATTVDDLFA